MATFLVTFTGSQSFKIEFTVSDKRMDAIIAAVAESAAPITRQREVNGVTESFEEARTPEEAIRDQVAAWIMSLDIQSIDHKKREAAKDAIAAITDVPEVAIVAASPP